MMALPAYLTDKKINFFITNALQEDIGLGDYTSLSTIPQRTYIKAKLMVKDSGILAGILLAQKIYSCISPEIKMHAYKKDGDNITAGENAFIVYGNAHHILATERLVLNCIQKMSGIATHTAYLKNLIKDTGIKILDTRKTTPNARIIEKWAVYIGGGKNHRYGLYDKILIKDNHIDIAGSIDKAVKNALTYLKKHHLNLPVAIEARNLTEVKNIIQQQGITTIMLDNMDMQTIKKAINIINKKYKIEISGGINKNNIKKIASCKGIDYISIGALTHTVKNMDMSLKFIK